MPHFGPKILVASVPQSGEIVAVLTESLVHSGVNTGTSGGGGGGGAREISAAHRARQEANETVRLPFPY